MGTKQTVTAHTRLSGRLALTAAAAIAFAAVLAPLPAPAAPNNACTQALEYEKTAASDSVTRQAAYDSAVAGLTANQRCTDAQMKLVNEAYLLSMRAAAEHELKIGNWQRDFERANMLLTQCTNWPGLRGKKAGTDCAHAAPVQSAHPKNAHHRALAASGPDRRSGRDAHAAGAGPGAFGDAAAQAAGAYPVADSPAVASAASSRSIVVRGSALRYPRTRSTDSPVSISHSGSTTS